MGQKLRDIVERVRRESRGLPNIDLARLNLRVGAPLSRMAEELADEPDLVRRANEVADEILREG